MPKLHLHKNGDSTITIWQIVMLFLCFYVLLALFVETAFRLPAETVNLLNDIDNLICLLFLGDFAYNLITAKSKRAYLKWGWIDLISSIPNFQFFSWGRIARVVRILRVLRAIRSMRHILKFLFTNRAKGTFVTILMMSFALIIFSSVVVLNCETDPRSNIKTASDALWWSFVTITTVGYGDHYPVTTSGRIMAVILMTAGVGLFGTFTAYIAMHFLQPGEKAEERREMTILKELREIKERLDRIEQDRK